MSSIMMDRWGLDCAIDFLQHGNYIDYVNCGMGSYAYHYGILPVMGWVGEITSRGENLLGMRKLTLQCWDNFLTAIVLWDEIWSCQTPYNWKDVLPNTVVPNLDSIIHQVDSSTLGNDLLPIYHELENLPSVDPRSFIRRSRSMSLSKRTERYQLLSFALGVPYLAHPCRIKSRSEDQSIVNRNDIIYRVDSELEKYYSHLNKQLGRNVYKFEYPVLIDYIVKNASSPKEELLAALALREEPDIVDFRTSMCEIEQIAQRGNQELLDNEIDRISDLAQAIITKHKWNGISGEFSLSIRPFNPSFSFSLPLKKGVRKDLHVTFIRKLLDYGVHERQRGYRQY